MWIECVFDWGGEGNYVVFMVNNVEVVGGG